MYAILYPPNKETFVHSKTLERVANKDPRIMEYRHDSDGHWLHLNDNWVWEDCISLHEYTVKDMLSAMSWIEERNG